MNKSYTLDELPAIAREIVDTVQNKVLLFYGEMGVGKTSLF